MNVSNLSIDTIGLSVRSVNALHRSGCHTVGEMMVHTQQSLSQIRHLGSKSIQEILEQIARFRAMSDDPQPAPAAPIGGDFEAWLEAPEHQTLVRDLLRREEISIDALELLSARAYNLLQFRDYGYLHQIVFLTREQLLEIPRMDPDSAQEILRLTRRYLRENQEFFRENLSPRSAEASPTIREMLNLAQYRQAIADYVHHNDIPLEQTTLSARPKNQLTKNGCTRLSDIIFLTKEEIQRFPAMGVGSVNQVIELIDGYLQQHEKGILAYCRGAEEAQSPADAQRMQQMLLMADETAVQKKILELYRESPFAGLHLGDIAQALGISHPDLLELLKKIIGGLLARKELEYVDFRCYRVYGKFADYLEVCTCIDARSRRILNLRLQGLTLDAIAQEYGLTRERVRQIIKRDVEKIRKEYAMYSGIPTFDEDYYRYFYETYAFDKRECSHWLGIDNSVWRYMDMMDVKQGKNDLMGALDDQVNLDAGLRLKVKNYLNRNKLYLDGMWVEKKRSSLELFVARKFCTGDTSYADFIRIYNRFLEREEIFDQELILTEAVHRSRKGILANSRFLLWKQNEMLRYYDIDGRDFTELLEELNLDSYENVEISTAKLMGLHPRILEKYDIRDQYELHNLLRKIIPEGSLHDFHCGRMPEIRFGEFDRDAAIGELLVAHSPISTADLCAIIQEEYGYEPGVTLGNYLQNFSVYYHQGIYSVDQKVMSPDNRRLLKDALTDDFYYLDEIRRIYRRLVPGGDPEEINPYNLKSMGFTVLSRYVLQNHASLEAYFESLFTETDIVDIAPLRERFVYVQMFYQKLLEMKRNLEVVEMERNTLIRFRKLERAGLTREMVAQFCDLVYEFVEDGDYFSISSLKEDGLESELFDFGFCDWFYANLLLSDDRFSCAQLLNNLILFRGKKDISIRDFVSYRICKHGSIDYFDLDSELTRRYGCRITDRRDILYRIADTQIYYDRILDRLYANAELYYRELDQTGGF